MKLAERVARIDFSQTPLSVERAQVLTKYFLYVLNLEIAEEWKRLTPEERAQSNYLDRHGADISTYIGLVYLALARELLPRHQWPPLIPSGRLAKHTTADHVLLNKEPVVRLNILEVLLWAELWDTAETRPSACAMIKSDLAHELNHERLSQAYPLVNQRTVAANMESEAADGKVEDYSLDWGERSCHLLATAVLTSSKETNPQQRAADLAYAQKTTADLAANLTMARELRHHREKMAQLQKRLARWPFGKMIYRWLFADLL